jgi:hypothetical protein
LRTQSISVSTLGSASRYNGVRGPSCCCKFTAWCFGSDACSCSRFSLIDSKGGPVDWTTTVLVASNVVIASAALLTIRSSNRVATSSETQATATTAAVDVALAQVQLGKDSLEQERAAGTGSPWSITWWWSPTGVSARPSKEARAPSRIIQTVSTKLRPRRPDSGGTRRTHPEPAMRWGR